MSDLSVFVYNIKPYHMRLHIVKERLK